jgi:hypothetical protein
MTPDEILSLADKAARTVLGPGAHYYWQPEDWEDAKQAAATGILGAIARYAENETEGLHEGWYFNAARHAIYDWWNMMRPRISFFPLLEYAHRARESDGPEPPPIDIDKLRSLVPFLARVRMKILPSTGSKIQEDIQYLWLRLQGYSMDGVGVEMNLSRRNTYAIRERLMPRLEMIRDGREPTPKPGIVSAASRANLDAVNRDPERLRLRGEAIRAAKAKRRTAAAGAGL